MAETLIKRALLVCVLRPCTNDEYEVDEFRGLAYSAGLECVKLVEIKRKKPDSCFFIGRGSANILLQDIAAIGIDVVVFNQALTPSQERNLKRYLGVRVIDRAGLILDIFAQRARSYEGKLQVELAQLQYLSTRLIRNWTHLERQQGGIGLRGPGETQLETDRRLIGKRIKNIDIQLERVRKQRHQGRRQRRKNILPTISLVGYTNAGKSTLFNMLTSANAYVAGQLFATLDPTLRRLKLKSGRQVILADTVGFISNLPHDLIASFNATLEEVRESDLLLHVVDISDADQGSMRIEQVNQVIEQIGANAVPQIMVYNKIDRIQGGNIGMSFNSSGQHHQIWLSARSGQGIAQLLSQIDIQLKTVHAACSLRLPATAGQLRASLFGLGVVRRERLGDDGGWIIQVEMDDILLHRLCRAANLDVSNLQYQHARY